MHSPIKCLLLSLCLTAATAIHAETLDVPDEQNQVISVQMPGRGMNMTAVEEKFGQPLTKHDAVGDPPITVWDYAGFSVYFEYQYVIHSVSTANPQ